MTALGTEITEALVRALLWEQHPDLAELPLREVEGGWGNQMWRLGADLAVRIQRMDIEPGPQLREREWLPLLAPRLPLPIPVPVRSGAPTQRFPKLWTVMTWVLGTPPWTVRRSSVRSTRPTLWHRSCERCMWRRLRTRRGTSTVAVRTRTTPPVPSSISSHRWTRVRSAARPSRPGRSGTTRSRRPRGRGRRCGCTATCIRRTSSWRTGPWRGWSTSATCSPVILRWTWRLPGCCCRRPGPASSPRTARPMRRRYGGPAGWPS